MRTSENAVIAVAALGVVLGLGLLAAVASLIGLPGDWAAVFAFGLIALFGFIIPQVYLSRTDATVSRLSRLGIVTLMMIVLAAIFSTSVSGVELTVIWSIAGLSIGAIFLSEVRAGYIQSLRSDG